jgi:hypothetical protein
VGADARDGRAALGPQRHPRPPREPAREEHAVAAAAVTFVSDVSDAEIAAYVATGEPLQVAGAFTVDSLGGPFIERVDGDPSTVVGMSLSTVRRLCKALGVVWTDLWTSSPSHRDGAEGGRDFVGSRTRIADDLVRVIQRSTLLRG